MKVERKPESKEHHKKNPSELIKCSYIDKYIAPVYTTLTFITEI
jgi:hypothetical protein